MPFSVIVSYDGSLLDRDALALGALLRDAGATLTLAYVRHAAEARADRELIVRAQAESRLRDGAARLADAETDIRLVMHPSTALGLAGLAEELGAAVIVFGSEHRTAHGHVGLGRSAQALLENGPAALAIAPAGLHERAGLTPADAGRALHTIGILPEANDEAATETARSLAACHGASVSDGARDVDLLVVGSRPHAAAGRVMVSASAAAAIEQARSPVLVTARETPLAFRALVTV